MRLTYMKMPFAIGPEFRRTLCAVVIAGVAIGAAAWLLKWLIAVMTRIAMGAFDTGGGNWWLILVATAGIMIVGWLVRNVIKAPMEHATELLKADTAARQGILPPRLTVAPVLASAITLGFGGSAGAESPIAYSGAAIGSNIARKFGFDPGKVFVFMACGAGAGIAAIFKAPLGGMLFTIEVLGVGLATPHMLLLAAMCLLGATTAYLLGGSHLNVDLGISLAADMRMIPAMVLTGVVCGLYSAFYVVSVRAVRRKLEGIRRLPVRNLVSGLALGVMLFLLPALYGEGYGILSELAAGHGDAVVRGSAVARMSGGWTLAVALAGLLLVKPAATADTNSGGGVAGDFTPTLFAGGVAGFFIATCCSDLAFIHALPTGIFMVCGMAAVMAGVTRAPFMTIFLVVEMTGAFSLLLPVAAVAFIAYGISRFVVSG